MNGILLIDKPESWTSNDVVQKLRSILHEKRIGHAGTLDPIATGLLTVFVGRATRAVEFAESDRKRYLAGLRLGLTTIPVQPDALIGRKLQLRQIAIADLASPTTAIENKGVDQPALFAFGFPHLSVPSLVMKSPASPGSVMMARTAVRAGFTPAWKAAQATR